MNELPSAKSRASRPPGSAAGTFAAVCTAAAIASAWIVFDPRVAESFVQPKFLLAEIFLALAATAALLSRGERGLPIRLPRGGDGRAVVALAAVAFAGAVLSAFASGEPAMSASGLRRIALIALAIPVGACTGFAERRRLIAGVFVAGAAVNAIIALLAYSKIFLLFSLEADNGRGNLGGLVGNSGYLGLALALALILSTDSVLSGSRPQRALSIAVTALLLGGLAVTFSVTGVVAYAAGGAVLAAVRLRRYFWRLTAAAVILGLAVFAAARPLQERAASVIEAARVGNWNSALTARGAPWLSAAEMIREHPWTGIGPGQFEHRFVPARIAAEKHWHTRLVVAYFATNSFDRAHNDYLDLVAAIGLPAGLAAVGAFGVLAVALARRARSSPEAGTLLALLAAGLTAAATWFPFEIAITSVVLLLAAGRGLRLIGEIS